MASKKQKFALFYWQYDINDAGGIPGAFRGWYTDEKQMFGEIEKIIQSTEPSELPDLSDLCFIVTTEDMVLIKEFTAREIAELEYQMPKVILNVDKLGNIKV